MTSERQCYDVVRLHGVVANIAGLGQTSVSGLPGSPLFSYLPRLVGPYGRINPKSACFKPGNTIPLFNMYHTWKYGAKVVLIDIEAILPRVHFS